MIDFKKQQKEVIIDLIKQDNPDNPLPSVYVVFDDPVERDPSVDIPRNTEITMRVADSDTPYRGNRTFYYNRVDINEFKYDGLITDDDFIIDPQAAVRSDELAVRIGQIFDIRIEPDMIISKPIPAVVSETVPYLIEFNPKNLTIIGTLQLYLRR